ncbi:cell envelope integrity protein TolA [Parendozoicomonas haliclonae]|uniref:Cell envelope integrity inner membrane protein TolA n=1 Tax=Parendozoicomonas haliclonae TaxID=1960125 RepID=A0A1X7AFY0_9GAMM|nr:TonB family protein [Parendozoicomonas haliclonae]SMA36480.1 hypothetical protein EHSB41UT_00654 [Parendozoicomonas haliclonae]
MAKVFSAPVAWAGQRVDNLREEGWLVPVVVSLVLHAVVVAMLLLVVPRAEERKIDPTPSFVTARMVTMEQAAPKPPPKKVRPVRTEKKTPVKQPVVKPKPKPDQQAIALKRKKEEERRKQQELAKKKEQERLKREKELADQRERERQQKLRREQLQKQQEQEMLAAMAREQQLAAQARADGEARASAEGVIRQLVEDQWSRPASAKRGMETVLRIQLLPTGELISVQIVTGSGDEAFDRSAWQAVERAAPFTELQALESRVFEQNFRAFRFKFSPQDLLN